MKRLYIMKLCDTYYRCFIWYTDWNVTITSAVVYLLLAELYNVPSSGHGVWVTWILLSF